MIPQHKYAHARTHVHTHTHTHLHTHVCTYTHTNTHTHTHACTHAKQQQQQQQQQTLVPTCGLCYYMSTVYTQCCFGNSYSVYIHTIITTASVLARIHLHAVIPKRLDSCVHAHYNLL